MKKTAVLAALTASCLAAPAYAEEADWTGAYIGVHVGYSGTKSDSAVTLGGNWSSEAASVRDDVVSNWSAQQSLDDMNFGGQIGYNYDAGGAVIGLEADFSILNGEDIASRGPVPTTAFPSLTYTYGNRLDPKNQFSVKAKLGAPMGNTLFYAHGGWAWTRAEVGAEILSNGNYSKEGRVTETFDGFTVGAGIEHKFSPGISARIEYAYTDQGDVTYDTAYRAGSAFVSPAYTETFTQDLRSHAVRLGINFHF
jgi:outer membrane immunogenic protein